MKTKTRRSWRWYVNTALNTIADWCMALAALVSQYEKPTNAELEQSSMRIQAMVMNKHEHPCPTCNGRGLVQLPGDDSAVCHACAGYGVNVDWIKAQP